MLSYSNDLGRAGPEARVWVFMTPERTRSYSTSDVKYGTAVCMPSLAACNNIPTTNIWVTPATDTNSCHSP